MRVFTCSPCLHIAASDGLGMLHYKSCLYIFSCVKVQITYEHQHIFKVTIVKVLIMQNGPFHVLSYYLFVIVCRCMCLINLRIPLMLPLIKLRLITKYLFVDTILY